MNMENKYPHLFREAVWPWGPTRVKFVRSDELPTAKLISNVNIVPRENSLWVMFQHQDDSWDIPGGTLEIGESYMETLRRELLEEIGAELRSFSIFGFWHCISMAKEPYCPHLPFPEYYRAVGTGEVKIIHPPTNPPDGEQIKRVDRVSLEMVVKRFRENGREDLAELYQLAGEDDITNKLPDKNQGRFDKTL